MPYYLGGKIKDRQSLIVTPVERLEQRFIVDLHASTEVTRIERQEQRVYYRRLSDGVEGSEPYDKLIISTGSKPFVPKEFNGVPGVFTLRNMRDMERIEAAVSAHSEHVVVIGAGFIGLEMVENLRARGVKKVTLVEMMPQVLGVLDAEMTRDVLNELTKNGVDVRLSDHVTTAQPLPDQRVALTLNSGAQLSADLVIVGAFTLHAVARYPFPHVSLLIARRRRGPRERPGRCGGSGAGREAGSARE